METDASKISVGDIVALALFGLVIVGGMGAYFYLTTTAALEAAAARPQAPARHDRMAPASPSRPSPAP
jgi:hypothetical protein